MASLARWCFRHRRLVLSIWILAFVLAGFLAKSVGSDFNNNFNLPATDSSRALDIVTANFHAQSGDSDQIVVHAKTGTLADPQTKGAVTAMFASVSHLGIVDSVTSPYQSGLISKDGTIGLATVQLDDQAQNIPTKQVQKLIDTAQAADSKTLQVELGGAAIENAAQQGGGSDIFIGALLALVVLFFAFRRSFLSALLPLLTALIAIGIGISFLTVMSHVFTVPQFATELAGLIALGVGVDYSLFIVNRHRRELLQGRSIEESAVRALNTSGRAVFVAGLTVCIALLGMFVLGLSFLYGVAVGAALVVLLTMISALTLLPAMLGFYGHKAISKRDRRALLDHPDGAPIPQDLADRGGSPFWKKWSLVVQRRSVALGLASLVAIVVVALPFFSMRLGFADSGEDATSSTTQHAYVLLAKGFGPGFNGPLQVVASIGQKDDVAKFDNFVASLDHLPGVARALPPRVSPNGKATVAIVYPSSTPQSAQTTDLVGLVRDKVPAATAGSTLQIHVGGFTAGAVDFSNVLSSKLPLFVAVIVILAFLLLAAVFRSLIVPLMASVMNILSIGAALGAITAAFQFGWLKPLLGYASAGPIESYLPVMMFAVLFGLSMDYEVFLVSRMHEEWLITKDNSTAVAHGQAETVA